MTSNNYKRGPMPIEERAKRFLASYAKYGGRRHVKNYRILGELEQCKIASQVLGELIKPDSQGKYYLTCPGITFHTNKSGRRDCRFTPGNGGGDARTAAPSLHCVHQSCMSIIEQLNHKIRSECGKASVEYITDHGSELNNAAAALIIGFKMEDTVAHKLLVTWGKTCTPMHSAIACGNAINAAAAAARKKPDEVGYLLRSIRKDARAASPSPETPSDNISTSFVSQPTGVQSAAKAPVYIGDKGRVAKQANQCIEMYRFDYGNEPTVLLLGPDQPEVGKTFCGLPVCRMNTPGISVGE